ncbi:MAG: glycosyltransferase [Lachnospiraceae bacterium]|nr:glycosyltransferase [Lachnospiraceae bacterium]
MKIHVYEGFRKTVEKSGVGRAMEHQKMIIGEYEPDNETSDFASADIVHINTVFPDSVIAALLSKALGKTVVSYGHSTMEDFKNSFKGSDLLAPLFKRWITFCYGLGDFIITPTEYSAGLIRSYGVKKPVEALSNGIDTSFWCKDAAAGSAFRKKYNIPDDKKVVISVGHFIGRKGIKEFVSLARKFPETEFIWFGYTNLSLVPSDIKEAVKGAPENVLFAGYVSKEELKGAYNGSDVFLFMSHEETEGIVVLEALSCGIETLVRDIPVYEGWLKDGCEVLKCNDDTFESTLRDVLLGKRKSAPGEGRKLALSRGYSKIGSEMNDFYRKYSPRKAGKYGKIYPAGR